MESTEKLGMNATRPQDEHGVTPTESIASLAVHFSCNSQNESQDAQDELPSPEQCLALLGRIAASNYLKRASRLRELLDYICLRSLKGDCHHINEHEIGCAVFGKPANYDTGLDNIVRTNVSELRKRIEAYFDGEGLHEAVTMEIPRGSYIPVFRYRPAELPADAAETQPDQDVPAGIAVSEAPARIHRLRRALLLCGFAIAALIGICLFQWNRDRAMQQLLYPWHHQPHVAALWSGILDSSQETDILLPDMGFALVQHVGGKHFTFMDYLNRRYIDLMPDLSADKREDLKMIDARSLGNPGGFKLALQFLALDPLHQNIHMYFARDYMPDLLLHHNLILIGARMSNPWDDLFQDKMNFFVDPEADSTTVANRKPGAGEQAVYTSSDANSYCVVAYLPNPTGSNKVLLMQGTNQQATQACGEFLLSEEQLTRFQKMLNLPKLPYFEVLLKTSHVRNTPFTAEIETYRIYPNLH